MMNTFLDLARSRRSIRKFTDQEIPNQDLEYFIQVAVSAPSGCNSQCWRFIAVKDRKIITQIETAVIQKTEAVLAVKRHELTAEYLSAKRKSAGLFAKAPLVIAVFMTKIKFFDPILIAALKEQGYDEAGIIKLYANYDLLSVGAAIQNMLLAIHEKGYGACWMNEPAIAGAEIIRILEVPPDERFISLIPVGHPAYIPRTKEMKDLAKMFSAI
jgi:nitroreductase